MSELFEIKDSQILSLINGNVTVDEMAKKLKLDYNSLFDYYADCSLKDRKTYPIDLLITKEWLASKLKSSSVSDICSLTKTSHSVILRLIKKYDLETKPKTREILSRELLYSLFVDKSYLDKEIALKYNCSVHAIKRLRKKYGITSESRPEAEPIISIEYFHKLYVEYGFSVKYLAELMNTTQYQVKLLIRSFSKQDNVLADEIQNRKIGFTYNGIIDEIMKELEPTLVFESLKKRSLTELAELYEIIPPAIKGITTLSQEWLSILLKRLDITTIMCRYHVSQKFISSQMEGTEMKALPPIERLDEQTIRRLYLELYYSDKEIAQVTDSLPYTVKEFRKKHGIDRSGRMPLKDRLSQDEFIRLYINEKLTVAQIATLYKVQMSKIYDLKKQYSKNIPEFSSHKSSGASDERIKQLENDMLLDKIEK